MSSGHWNIGGRNIRHSWAGPSISSFSYQSQAGTQGDLEVNCERVPVSLGFWVPAQSRASCLRLHFESV